MAEQKSVAPARELAVNAQRWVTNAHTWLYRRTGGAMGGHMFKVPVLLLMTKGRKTGLERTTPLMYLKDGRNYVIVASNGGAPKHPTWWLNLEANPAATIQVRRDTVAVRAVMATGAEWERLWQRLVALYPSYADYQKRTQREIPVIVLEPVV